QNKCEIPFGCHRTRIVFSRTANAEFEDFTVDAAGLLHLILVQHDFAEGAQQLDARRVLRLQSRRNLFEGLSQKVYCLCEVTGAPERDRQRIRDRKCTWMARTELRGMRL